MKYVTPEMEIVKLNMNDIVCESNGMSSAGSGGIGDSNVGTDAPDNDW